ncbi:D-inositol-3-phosphate glycosyltransferase [uncultured archaeon]|nr:D-inositol-3-phosphate glycosyltransferase [uncultured archaeon]
MPRHNIAFYSDTYLPAVDGVVTSMLTFKKELERRGNKVYIFASKKGIRKSKAYESEDVFLYPGVDFKPYPQYSVAVFPFYSSLKLSSLGIDVIHSQTPFMMGFNALIAAKIGKIPLVSTYHTMIDSKSSSAYYPKNNSIKKFAGATMWKYIKFYYNQCDVTIAPSQAVADMLGARGVGNTRIVPNSIDLKRFNPKVRGDAMRARLGLKDKERVVLYLGRVSREKKIEVMLKAARSVTARNRDVTFVVGGTGPAVDYYRRAAKKLGVLDRVRFIGFVEDKDLPGLYAASDVLCLPSTFETQGIVSIEAMAVGKPVVAADYLALRELIENGANGERFKAGDYTSCARKIEKVLNKCDAYRKEAVKTAGKFSVEKVTDELLKVYDSVVD